MRLEEAVEVLDTLLEVGGAKLPPADAVGARLRRARVYRKLNEFDAADQSPTPRAGRWRRPWGTPTQSYSVALGAPWS